MDTCRHRRDGRHEFAGLMAPWGSCPVRCYEVHWTYALGRRLFRARSLGLLPASNDHR